MTTAATAGTAKSGDEQRRTEELWSAIVRDEKHKQLMPDANAILRKLQNADFKILRPPPPPPFELMTFFLSLFFEKTNYGKNPSFFIIDVIFSDQNMVMDDQQQQQPKQMVPTPPPQQNSGQTVRKVKSTSDLRQDEALRRSLFNALLV